MSDWGIFTSFIKENRAGALATIDGDKPQVRAVVFVSLEEENVIYTTTNVNSHKVVQIQNNPNVSFFIWKEHDFFRGEGKAEIINDLALKKRILGINPRWKKHYPLGAEDPNYCLIKINIDNLEAHFSKVNK
ncbi:MAG: pyridoxamine 5'-phosphate oxidase family protein [Nanoarchaeota archaeon]|nr:pyridoxamine 5'-phosphate oxidase family protein [Nanoarchaeota archaeon]